MEPAAKLVRQRVQIGCNFHTQPTWKWLVGVPLIYIPILVTVPPLILAVWLVRAHLTLVGGHNLNSYWNDFAPSWASHRYTRKTQILSDGLVERFGPIGYLVRFRLFWVFNCNSTVPFQWRWSATSTISSRLSSSGGVPSAMTRSATTATLRSISRCGMRRAMRNSCTRTIEPTPVGQAIRRRS